MGRLRKSNSNEMPGQDSFLDIIANLIGVLIILVVVVGANAGSKLHDAARKQVDPAELDELASELDKKAREAFSMQLHNDEMEDQILIQKQLVAMREHERTRMLVFVEETRQALDDHKLTLTEDQQKQFESQQILESRQRELQNIQYQVSALESRLAAKNTIEHFPTPIAQTVFSDEIHYRLKNGRLVHVPMNELVELMRNEWQEKAKKLTTATETIETVGPIEDFRLQYQLQMREVAQPTAVGNIVRKTTEFTRFVLVPISENVGTPLEIALRDGSSFTQTVDRLDPKTTISVWVYPDSYQEFNQLKKWLYDRGMQTACWPLSESSLISGGPSGFRSTAQ